MANSFQPVRIGIVGCGNISGIYFENLTKFAGTEVVAAADLDVSRAEAAAAKYRVPNALTVDALLAHPDIEIVVNLTIPAAHAEVARAAVAAGKHVYNEKPLTIAPEDAHALLFEAAERGVRVGGAPDTFLGGAHQTARAAIARGDIGEPIGAHAFMLCHGHESWHPAPEFYYKAGGGPMLDMGPYYLTDLVQLMGPIRRVAGSARITFPTRTITSQPKAGTVVEVETPTHIAGIMDFQNGAIGEITTSFDVWHAVLPPISIYGTEGSMLVPDPNGFGGEVKLRAKGQAEWHVVPNVHMFNGNDRGIGVLDMGVAIREGRPHRASGDLAAHVLSVMTSFGASSDAGTHLEVAHLHAAPAPLGADELAPYL
jgi:predicted dehydrogenase